MYEETGNKSIALAFNKGNWGLNDLCFRKMGNLNLIVYQTCALHTSRGSPNLIMPRCFKIDCYLKRNSKPICDEYQGICDDSFLEGRTTVQVHQCSFIHVHAKKWKENDR